MKGIPPSRVVKGRPEFEDEHQELMAIAVRIEAASGRDEAEQVLGELYGCLPGHLADEERPDGLFDWILALDPSQGGEVAELRAEHGALRAKLADARRAVGEGQGVHEACVDLVSALREHEAREAAAVRAALG